MGRRKASRPGVKLFNERPREHERLQQQRAVEDRDAEALPPLGPFPGREERRRIFPAAMEEVASVPTEIGTA